METKLTYEGLAQENERLRTELRRKEERILYLERMLFGSKRDKAPKAADPREPTFFDELFDKALEEKEREIAKTREEIQREARARRSCKPQKPKRPAEYLYSGLEERWHTEMPTGGNPDDYDIIGRDVTRTLHREPAKFWVECTERPILRRKGEKDVPRPEIIQAPAPVPVIGGNHVGADLLAQMVVDKYCHHLPEYRQVKMIGQMGVRLPVSTVNRWVHATADKLYPLYESLCEDILKSDYMQVDEVPWRIADRKDKCRKGYAWQFMDARPETHGLFFLYHKGSRGGEVPRSQLQGYRGALQVDGYKVYDFYVAIQIIG